MVFVPATPLATSVARGLLPASVSHDDAAANAGRTALLVAALAGQPEHLLAATRDFVHQHYREPAMPQTLGLVSLLRDDGVPAVVSGAGPTVLAFCEAGADEGGLCSRAPEGWSAWPLRIERVGAVVT